MSTRILLVDDDEAVREALSFSLRDQNFQVRTAHSAATAMDALAAEVPDLVVTDLRMPGGSGLELIQSIRERGCSVPVIVVTAFGSIDAAMEAVRLGAADFLEKPVRKEVLRHAIDRVMRTATLTIENAALRARLQEDDPATIFTVNAGMQRVLDLVDRVAPTDATVLLTGESGTGKELAARRIHQRSRRATHPFIAVNCAALPADLLESELFGHAKGAFTGAQQSRRGRFVEAHNGTLFLDEIGDLPHSLQAKLLRVLQERSVDVVGGGTVDVDVRIVTATHQDLSRAIDAGTFREDLFYRLNVLPIHLPPLRARRDDIGALFSRFVARAARRAGLPIPPIAPALLTTLALREWPGNIRELENVATRLALTTNGMLTEDALTSRDGALRGGASTPASGVTFADGELVLPASGISLDELERAAVCAALSAAGGNRAKAARFLSIPRHVLLYRIAKHQIRDEELADFEGEPRARLRRTGGP